MTTDTERAMRWDVSTVELETPAIGTPETTGGDGSSVETLSNRITRRARLSAWWWNEENPPGFGLIV